MLLSALRESGLSLQGVDLTEAVLDGADLSDAELEGADLSGASLDGAMLSGARYSMSTRWPEGFDPQDEGAVLAHGWGAVPEDD
jgi:uncharacterized protein YjbI with pentapeptide repeats